MLLGLELLSLLIKIKWVKNHGDGHENGADPYSLISLCGLCIAFALHFPSVSYLSSEMSDGKWRRI